VEEGGEVVSLGKTQTGGRVCSVKVRQNRKKKGDSLAEVTMMPEVRCSGEERREGERRRRGRRAGREARGGER